MTICKYGLCLCNELGMCKWKKNENTCEIANKFKKQSENKVKKIVKETRKK